MLEINPRIIFDPQACAASGSDCDCSIDCSGGDCACGSSERDMMAPVQSLIYSSEPDRLAVSYHLPVDESHHTIHFGPRHQPVILNDDARRILGFLGNPDMVVSKAPDVLVGAAVSQFDQYRMVYRRLGLLQPAYAAPIPDAFPDTLTAWLQVTDRCNLDCVYCYRPRTSDVMSYETGVSAIRAVLSTARQRGFRQVRLKYGGGEPLLRFEPLVAPLHGLALDLAEQTGLLLRGMVLSNGTLLNASVCKRMKELRLSLMLSLDGTQLGHDVHRRYTDGRGSHADTMRAVQVALDCGIVPTICITLSHRNIAQLGNLIHWILERDLPFKINYHRDHDRSLLKDGPSKQSEQFVAGMLAAYKVIEANLPKRNLLSSLLDQADLAQAHDRPCGVGHSYIAVDCAGRVAKCQMTLDDTYAAVGETVDLVAAVDTIAGLQNAAVEAKPTCRDCMWRYWCRGGCPLNAYRTFGNYCAASPNCEIQRQLLPAAIRLEGLRLLKYHSPAIL